MKTKNLKYYISAVLVFVLLAAAVTYAASMYRLSYVEKFETDKVDIQIQEITAVKEGEDPEKQLLAEANKELSYIPRIINRAADCYVRLKVEIDTDGDCRQPLGAEQLYGLNEDWVIRDDYFYYTKILAEGQQTDLCEGLYIPENWDYGTADGINIDIKAEAVQSANFEPDFHCNLPWGAVELKAVASATGSKCVEATPVSFISDVEYDSSGGFQCDTADLFDEFTGMMPGDCCEKTVKIKNKADYTLNTSLDISADESEFTRKMGLKIFNDDTEIYSGTVFEAANTGSLSISEIPKGENGAITFQVCLPVDADNNYAKVKDNVVWSLNVEEVPDTSVQTGDYTKLMPYALAAIAALLLMTYAVVNRRKDNDETNN